MSNCESETFFCLIKKKKMIVNYNKVRLCMMKSLVWSEEELLPKIIPEMCVADFWKKDTVDEIKSPLFDWKMPTQAFRDYYQMVKTQFQKGFWDTKHNQLQFDHYQEIWDLLERLAKHELEIIAYGLVLERTDLKLLPQIEPFFNEPKISDLDRNQFSGLELGDECLIFAMIDHWYGVITKRGVGWVLSQMVGIGEKTEVAEFVNAQTRITLIEPEVYLQTAREKFLASMGCSFPQVAHQTNQVWVPVVNQQGKLIFEAAKIVNGMTGGLAPTSENILQQAFKYLGTPYAWGDRDCVGVGIDCSRLVQNILLSLRVNTPRYSQEQLLTGVSRFSFAEYNCKEIINKLQKISPGSLLFTKSHVMIYLGFYQDQPYIIHALYSFHKLTPLGEVEYKVKRVIVSDLQLGQNTTNDSLLARLTGAVEIC